MTEAVVRNLVLNYEIIGDHGPWIALTPGSRRPYDELVPLSKMLAEGGYRVLLHDRRNCGGSEVGIESTGSEHEIWADDLHELCRQLDALPVFVGGSSAGARLAILFAMRHPTAVSGLLLWRVTGGRAATEKLAKQYYGDFIDIARKDGMEGVCHSAHFSECIARRPSNRERLMRMEPNDFIATMEFWRRAFIEAANLPIIGATEQDLQAMAVPACVIAGNDVIHAPEVAARFSQLVPMAEFHDDVVEKLGDGHLRPEWDAKEWRAQEPRMASIYIDFTQRAAAGKIARHGS
jgi:pimeloyl-ACP methyl ester carboxylesterase